jgi:hypothetical protein
LNLEIQLADILFSAKRHIELHQCPAVSPASIPWVDGELQKFGFILHVSKAEITSYVVEHGGGRKKNEAVRPWAGHLFVEQDLGPRFGKGMGLDFQNPRKMPRIHSFDGNPLLKI